MFSNTDSEENFLLLLVAARYLFVTFLQNGFLLKGGMAHGEISVDIANQMYFGQPIIDAYLLEEDVNYLGVVMHNTIDSYINKLSEEFLKETPLQQLWVKAKTPLKSGQITHYNLDWFCNLEGIKKTECDTVKELNNRLEQFYTTVSSSPRRYIDNTLDFIDKNEKHINKAEINF